MLLRPAADKLLKLTRDPAVEVRRASLEALGRMREPRALPMAVAALDDRETVLPALEILAEMGGPAQAKAVTELARREPSVETLAAVGRVLTGWMSRMKPAAAEHRELEQALAEIHGSSGVLLAWHVLGPVAPKLAAEHVSKLTSGQGWPTGSDPAPGWRLLMSAGMEARLRLGPKGEEPGSTWFAVSEVTLPTKKEGPVPVEFFSASSGLESIWLNDKLLFQRDKPGIIGPNPDRFEANLTQGRNRILVRFQGAKAAADFQLRFRHKSAREDHERLTRAALSRNGNAERGRQIFLNADKSLCSKCHRVGDKGERIGPDLTGLGSRFSRVHIVESILEPSRTIAPSYETTALVLKNGKILYGIKIAETEAGSPSSTAWCRSTRLPGATSRRNSGTASAACRRGSNDASRKMSLSTWFRFS